MRVEERQQRRIFFDHHILEPDGEGTMHEQAFSVLFRGACGQRDVLLQTPRGSAPAFTRSDRPALRFRKLASEKTALSPDNISYMPGKSAS